MGRAGVASGAVDGFFIDGPFRCPFAKQVTAAASTAWNNGFNATIRKLRKVGNNNNVFYCVAG